MRLLSALLWTTVASALLASCSGDNTSSSPGASLPGSGLSPQTAGHSKVAVTTIPKSLIKKKKYRSIKAPASDTRGIAVSEASLRSNNVFVYPHNDSGNNSLTCIDSSGGIVNDVDSDSNANLIVPNAFEGVLVYAPPFTGSSCGTLLGKITDSYGQATSASASDAVNGTIVVGNIGGGSGAGVVTCTLSSLNCTPLNSPNMGQLGGVVMDSAGNCYADAFDLSGNVGLWLYNGCTGTGKELTGAKGFNEPYFGGLDVDDQGDLVVVSILNASLSIPSTVTVYSGCSTGTCTVKGGPYSLQGESVFGHLGGQDQRWVTTDITNSDVEVYNYAGHGTGINYLYSFNNGLSCATNLCESAAYMPASKGI